MAKVILFGLQDTAELAHYYLDKDSSHEVVAFTVHEQFRKKNSFRGLPVINFEEILEKFPPNDFSLFAPMTAKKMNTYRQKIYLQGKESGYQFISYVSSKATIFDNEIGENCFILENNTIQPFTSIGNNVVMWSGNHIGHHGKIKDHIFFTSHVVLSGNCIVNPNCFLGVNATVRDFTNLAKGTLLGMGACLVDQKTEEWSVYLGNPATLLKDKNSFDVY